MTITPATLYWLTRLDSIQGLMILIIVICAFAGAATAIQWGINEPIGELQQEKAKIEHQVNVAKQVVSSAVALVADAKLDFQRKQAHWKELNKQYQFLCNQNKTIKKGIE